MKKATSRVSKRQEAELKALAELPDNEIDTREIAEVRDWSGAARGVFHRAVKQQLTLRLDADVVAWFKARAPGGRGYRDADQPGAS